MTDKPIEPFFTPKHARLFRIARLANFFAWVALIIFILSAVAQAYQSYRIFDIRASVASLQGFQNAFTIARTWFGVVEIVFKGAVYSLVLKGISVGLNMIIETDLNYRGQALEESHE